MLYLHVFLITMHQIDRAAEVHLEPFQTYMIAIFFGNCYQLLEAVVQRCSVNKVFLEISLNSLENTCARVSF